MNVSGTIFEEALQKLEKKKENKTEKKQSDILPVGMYIVSNSKGN